MDGLDDIFSVEPVVEAAPVAPVVEAAPVVETPSTEGVKVTDPALFEGQDEPTPVVTTDDIFDTSEDSDEPVPVEAEGDAPAPVASDNLYEVSAAYLAEKFGINLPEGDYDAETFPVFLQELVEFEVGRTYDALKSSNPVANAILQVIEEGGDESKVLAIFREQKNFAQFDTSTAEGKLGQIKHYYKEVEKKDPSWIDKFIVKPLSIEDDTKSLDEEFNSVNKRYQDHIKESTDKEVAEAQKAREGRERALSAQRNQFAETLNELKMKPEDVDSLVDYVFNDNAFEIRSTGQTISGFDADVIRAKKNPTILKDLTLFLKDKAAYERAVINRAKNEFAEKSFDKKFKDLDKLQGAAKKSQEAVVAKRQGFNITSIL